MCVEELHVHPKGKALAVKALGQGLGQGLDFLTRRSALGPRPWRITVFRVVARVIPVLSFVVLTILQVRADIRADHERQGLIKPRQGRKNHKSVGALLAVPRYCDLLEDQEDEDPSERGRALVSSTDGWRTEMAKWVADSKAAEVVERAEAAEKAKWKAQRETLGLDSDSELEEEDTPRLPKTPRWKPITLATLFGLSEKPLKRKPSESARVLEEEERLMEALAEMEARADADEDARMDDGAIEIDSDDEYR
ncbi:hypothetical protein C8F04DRAFT_1176428 [Mycena alexandri]|uniref:Uncharacterized protein n=1 Tax=Mycena alexandri TaxID=1745969 RepID=A0AAD6TA56_9AGAR|nr:hypothetical protein C8F04DRAFT_1176428 [Mycena alexandri]